MRQAAATARSLPRSLAAGLALAVLLAPVHAQEPSPAPPHAAALQEGKDLLRRHDFKEAVRAFKQADKLSGGACAECQMGLAFAFYRLGAHKDALKAATEALRLAPDDETRVAAFNQQGLAIAAAAEKDQAKLAEAEAAFRRSIELGGAQATGPRFNLGEVLLRQGRDEEGVAVLKQYLELEPNGETAERAKELIANPLRARKALMPEIEAVTLSGEYLTSEELRGKVVLLDFWGTWCAPCVAAVPSLKGLAKRFADQPFVLVSVSTDDDEAALKEFVAKNQMTWTQVWDEHHEITRKCGVESYPTYLLVSHDGEVVYGTRGWSDSIEREIGVRVAAALRAAKKSGKQGG